MSSILFKSALKRTSFLLSVACLFFTQNGNAQTSGSNVLKIKNTQDLLDYLHYTANDVPLISGHRGGTTKGYPENCIATFENTLRHTPAFFEIDPRLTKDSIIVLLHDDTLGRTTNGTGKLSAYTWEEVKKLKLKDPEGNVTAYGLPTLEEVIQWSKEKTIINLDHKDVPLQMTANLLKKLKAEAHVMLTVHNAKDAKFYYSRNPALMFSAFVLTKSAMDEYEAAGIPWSHMIAYIGPVNKPENKELYDLLHAKGVMCMISAAPKYDKLKEAQARKAAYEETIKAGADIIESDLPIEAAEAIRPLMPKQSPKQKFFGKRTVEKGV